MAKPTVLYTVKQGTNPRMFTMSKLTADMEVMAVYYLQESEKGNGLACSCPAHKPWCRHCEILRLFQGLDRVGAGYFYNFDQKVWIEPNKLEE